MKYGESIFDILYLLFAVVGGSYILIKSHMKAGKMMGIATLILGVGDAFHLIPRVLNYFIDGDFNIALGIGKLVTSVTMTIFYVLLYYVWSEHYKIERKRYITGTILLLALIRIVLCAFPQNGWFTNSSDVLWGIIRNVPFVILGTLICYFYFNKRKEDKYLKPTWSYILLSFLFYIPVAVAASLVPILGMLMLPKTICYILMVISFILSVSHEK